MRKAIFFIIIIVIAGLAFLAGDRYGKDQGAGSNAPAAKKVLYYTDPMNPGFRSEKPGTAPCGMPLEPVYAEAEDGKGPMVIGGPKPPPGAVKISAARQQLIGVHVSPVTVEPMTYSLRLYGKVVPDETKIYRVNTSTDTWVQVLSDVTTGGIVKKDQVLAEVLDPDFYTAQVTYLVSLNNVERYRDKLGGDMRLRQIELADNQMRVAIQDLLDLGITEAQVQELAETRKAQPFLQVRAPVDGVVLSRNLTLNQWIRAGEEFYRIADLGRVWVYADVYEDEARYLRPGMEVQVVHPGMGKTFAARVSQVLPLFDSGAKTLKMRIDVANPDYDLRPDMFVDVEIPITMPPSLHVPADAVIDSGTTRVVYVDIGNSTFEPRRIETGWRLGRQIEVLDGLMPGEKVIVSGNFLVDSESRMKSAAAGMHGTTSRDPVCGMYVDQENAAMSGKTATFDGRTYYFCMVQCKESFEKEPEKYVPKEDTSGSHEVHAAKAVQEKGWLEMLESERDRLDMEGKDQAPGDRSGMEKFSQEKYLGLKKTEGKNPSQPDGDADENNEAAQHHNTMSPAAAPASGSAAGKADMHEEMHEEMPEMDAPAQPEQPVDR
jgi:Cu(I)/Ag(I) efflux system membrane fusion protein